MRFLNVSIHLVKCSLPRKEKLLKHHIAPCVNASNTANSFFPNATDKYLDDGVNPISHTLLVETAERHPKCEIPDEVECRESVCLAA